MVRRSRIALVIAVLFATSDHPERIMAAPGQAPQPADAGQARKAGGGPNRGDRTNNIYLVQMAEVPVGSYEGGLPGLARTKPNRGEKIDPASQNVLDYAGHLGNRHDQALSRVGGGRKIYDYKYTFNGFAVALTEAQAEALRTAPGVVSVIKDTIRTADTSSTPTLLGLDAADGLWRQLGIDRAGEDIVIGIVDSGIWPESPSFSDRTDTGGRGPRRGGPDRAEGKSSYRRLHGWHGKCETGEQFTASACNGKVIGARYFNDAWGGDAAIAEERPWEFTSPRDYNGHGTHTAATAGGNHGVPTTGPTSVFGHVSGMAPRARISVYKALWSTQDAVTASGFTSDLVAAIDHAVADGVDVINFSISGTQTNFLDPVEVAFLFAADAGVFVAASAGNDGPTTGTVAHPSPWIATVAAGTHNRDGRGSVRLGNGVVYTGSSVATAVGPAPLINSTAAGLPGANATALSLCFTASDNGGTPVLDSAKVAGRIVVCDRGVNARVNKSLAVKQAGGVGMILVNTSPNSVNADLHSVPTVHLPDTDRAAVRAYAAGIGPTATINQATLVYNVPAPYTASFSSRGPLLAGAGDLLKPDLIAPGQDIVAAVAPPGNAGLSFNVYSGTSMASPHVAGLAALLKDRHRDWSPMMIKSALMTSAYDVLDLPNTNPLEIFRQGAGHVRPNKAADPGLVYDSNANDWLAFLCGTTSGVNATTCAALAAAGYSLDPSDFNGASIAIGDLAGVQTVTRYVTNVGHSSATYSPAVTGMAGFTVKVNPATLTIKRGQTKGFQVTFTRTAAALNSYVGGQLTWSDGIHNVRSPLVVRPVALAAPSSVFGTGGPISYGVTFGYTGAFAATPRGLVPATTTAGSVADDPTDSFSPTGPGVVAISVTIPAATTYARFSLFDANVTPASDLDLYVANSAGTVVAASGGGTSAEEVNLLNPAPGTYTVYVHGFGVTSTANFTLFSWLLGSAPAGNMAVSAPSSATTGATGTINVTFGALAPATKFLGSVVYSGIAGLPDPTIVRVDTP